MKRVVAITQRVDIHPNRNERRDALDQRWYAFAEACGIVALPMPNRRQTAVALAEASPVCGLILTGGNDIVAVGGDAPERDETEEALIDWARSRKLPIFAVCRGMQFLAHTFGARLVPAKGHAGTAHEVLTDDGRCTVNSYHNWCIETPPEHFTVLARAPDGTVESMRHISEPIAAVMWHPEREKEFSRVDLSMLKELLGASR